MWHNEHRRRWSCRPRPSGRLATEPRKPRPSWQAGSSRLTIVVVQQSRHISQGSNRARAELGGLSVLAGTVPDAVTWERGAPMRDDWSAARRLVSAFHCGAADNVVAVVDDINTAGRWRAVALASVGEVAAMANHVHGSAAQGFLDQRSATALNRDRQAGIPEVNSRCYRIERFSVARGR